MKTAPRPPSGSTITLATKENGNKGLVFHKCREHQLANSYINNRVMLIKIRNFFERICAILVLQPSFLLDKTSSLKSLTLKFDISLVDSITVDV